MLARAAERRVGEFSPQTFANTAWTFATASPTGCAHFGVGAGGGVGELVSEPVGSLGPMGTLLWVTVRVGVNQQSHRLAEVAYFAGGGAPGVPWVTYLVETPSWLKLDFGPRSQHSLIPA